MNTRAPLTSIAAAATLFLSTRPLLSAHISEPHQAAKDTAVPENASQPNRLARESSPYLLQHANNPVDWFPWGEEAFAEARRRKVPIFLSIGYSTCYWCHVMERESFEDPQTAAIMNEHFVCIKVDREERPDVDDIYMAATQLMTGSGGWPMNSFLDPSSLKPFWCGTYFPPQPMQGRPSFSQVLRGMSDVWTNKTEEAREQAENLAAAVQDHLAADAEPAALGPNQISSTVRTLLQIFDRTEGGFGGAPKFPQPVYALFLLDARPIVDDETRTAIDHAIRFTLDRMAIGGLFDQVGGGFHRYCVDGTWTVPHFEKMLYDNAQLLSLYSRAANIYDDQFYREIASRTRAYVEREMTGNEGGFFSAQDAEVDHREGLNYLWTEPQITQVLESSDAPFALDIYGVADGTNFLDPHHPDDGPKNVLRLAARPEEVAQSLGLTPEAFQSQRARIDAQLLAAREQRKQPGLDDKIITSWNAMMIVGLADAARALNTNADASPASVLSNAHEIETADRALSFLLTNLLDNQGGLARSYRETQAASNQSQAPRGVLEDHAWLIRALLAMHNAGRGKGEYLRIARETAETIQRDFGSDEGHYSDVAEGRDDLFVRARSTYDGATPSGIGVIIHALIELHHADPTGPWLERARAQLKGISHEVADRPVSAVNAVRTIIEFIAIDGNAAKLAFGSARIPATDRPDAISSASVVEIYADEEAVTVTDADPATITLGIRIKPGYHILAADPAAPGADPDQNLIPLRVGLISGGGIAVYAEYPEGSPYGADIVGTDDLRVHSGELRLTIAIEKKTGIGAGPGEPLLGITFQACDNTACLKPATVRLGVQINIE